MSNVFFDSNIWIYFFEQTSHKKYLKVDDLLQNNNVFLSTQVVNEVIKNLHRKYNFSHNEIRSLISYFFCEYDVISLDHDVLNLAVSVRENYSQFDQNKSFWDSNIIAAGMISGATIVYTEDWQHGDFFEVSDYKINVVNPFV